MKEEACPSAVQKEACACHGKLILIFRARQIYRYGRTAEINTSVPAGVYLFPNPRQRFALRIWPGTIQVSRSR